MFTYGNNDSLYSNNVLKQNLIIIMNLSSHIITRVFSTWSPDQKEALYPSEKLLEMQTNKPIKESPNEKLWS